MAVLRRPVELAGILLSSTEAWRKTPALGQLTRLQEAVSADYARSSWVRRRCKDARRKILRYVAGLKESDPLLGQVTHWLFATGGTTHVLLAAGPGGGLSCYLTEELLLRRTENAP